MKKNLSNKNQLNLVLKPRLYKIFKNIMPKKQKNYLIKNMYCSCYYFINPMIKLEDIQIQNTI